MSEPQLPCFPKPKHAACAACAARWLVDWLILRRIQASLSSKEHKMFSYVDLVFRMLSQRPRCRQQKTYTGGQCMPGSADTCAVRGLRFRRSKIRLLR